MPDWSPWLDAEPETIPLACAKKGEARVAISDVQSSFDVLFICFGLHVPPSFWFLVFGNSEVLSSWP